MSVRLVRENSDTPNVTNKDDARMVRYAYGGQNGYVQKYGRELDYIPNGNIFTIGSGMAVLQGWEVVIDSNGWQLELSTSDVTKRYYLVYLEVNLTLGGSAEIKSKTDELDYPTIEEGDDLTENLNGIAYLELYRFTATRGVVTDVEKIVQAIPYGADEVSGLNGKINVINQRLQNLGFKQGVVSVYGGGIGAQNYVKRQGNYVYGNVDVHIINDLTAAGVTGVIGIGSIPYGFWPKEEVKFGFKTRPVSVNQSQVIPQYGIITQSGLIRLYWEKKFEPSTGGSLLKQYLLIVDGFSFGYECNPL